MHNISNMSLKYFAQWGKCAVLTFHSTSLQSEMANCPSAIPPVAIWFSLKTSPLGLCLLVCTCHVGLLVHPACHLVTSYQFLKDQRPMVIFISRYTSPPSSLGLHQSSKTVYTMPLSTLAFPLLINREVSFILHSPIRPWNKRKRPDWPVSSQLHRGAH